MLYEVKWNYRSSLGGPWAQGDIVDVGEQRAAEINRDSPGVLVPGAEVAQPETQSEASPDSDRAVRRPAQRRDRQGDPGDQGPITKANFKATRS